MKKVLYILGELEDEHVSWLTQAGRKHHLEPGETLIRQGEPIDAVYIVVEGLFSVTREGSDVGELAQVGAGEVLGEISYVDRHPPTATVTAVDDSVVLELPREALTEKIESDPGFAARFYHALAAFLADRLRSTLAKLGPDAGGGDTDDLFANDELDLDRLDHASKGGLRFERILKRLQEF